MNDRPKIRDNDNETISVELDGKELMSWSYGNREDQREKMRHAHYFCDGFMCAMGAPRVYPGTSDTA